MNKQITFRGMDSSPTMENQINEWFARFEHILKNERDPIYIHVVVDAGYTHHHYRVECNLKTPHYDLHVHDEGPNMHDVINITLETMHHKLAEAKRKLVDKNHTGAVKRG